jgi:ABC-type transporter MlaC component
MKIKIGISVIACIIGLQTMIASANPTPDVSQLIAACEEKQHKANCEFIMSINKICKNANTEKQRLEQLELFFEGEKTFNHIAGAYVRSLKMRNQPELNEQINRYLELQFANTLSEYEDINIQKANKGKWSKQYTTTGISTKDKNKVNILFKFTQKNDFFDISEEGISRSKTIITELKAFIQKHGKEGLTQALEKKLSDPSGP